MSRGLKARNKLGFVDGTLTLEKTKSSKASKWERVNAVVHNWILGLILKLYMLVMYILIKLRIFGMSCLKHIIKLMGL